MNHRHLHFVQSLEPLQGGGLGGAARQLHAAMQSEGLSSQLVTTKSATFSQGWPEVADFVRSGPDKAFFAFGLRRWVEEWIGKGRGTLGSIHGHGFYVYPNAVIGGLARRDNLPLIYHPHGMFEPWILRRSRIKKRIAHALFEDANFRGARLWRALTNREADQIRAQGVTAPVIVLPNGIDLAEFWPLPRSSSQEGRTLLFLGRIHPKKGLDLLLSAWAAMGNERSGWRLCIAGPDEGGYAAKLQAQIASAGLGSSVDMPGVLVGAAKLAALRSANGFVLTSYSEGLPMAVLEAMACEVPVLISEECNLPEVSENGAGWSCPAEETAVRNSLREMLASDDAERRQRGLLGRKLVERSFRWSVIARELHVACQRIHEG